MDMTNANDTAAANPYPRGPPMTDMTNIQPLFRMKAMIEAGFDDADRLRLIVM